MTKKIITTIFASALLVSCSTKFKEKVGLVNAGPNEYKVETAKPLDMPPHYDLRAPKESKADSVK
ncbi:MAG: DUF3035 domain-containing protein [Rickettsiaceae bacterium]|nr:DUF3035 domain-containing protein [Rickettsiaceae bacterium]